MRHYILLIVFILLCSSYAHAQLSDITPPGQWKNFQTTRWSTGDGNIYPIAIGTDASDKDIFFYLRDAEFLQLDSNSIYSSITPIKESFGDGTYDSGVYFLATQESLLSPPPTDILFVNENNLSVVPSSGIWNQSTAQALADGSIFLQIGNREESNKLQATLLKPSGLEILDSTLYIDMGSPTQSGVRTYSYALDQSGVSRLIYYDINLGYVKISLAAHEDPILISGDPGINNHAIIINNASVVPSEIYRVNGSTFTRESIPGEPYDRIDLLYRNDDTHTSLFSAIDTSGDWKLLKRITSNWTDLTAQVANPEEINLKAAFTNEVFFEAQVGIGNLHLYSFQSYASGDTLIDVTPTIDTFYRIKKIEHDVLHPVTFEMNSINGSYLYDFFYGLSPLIKTPSALMNPTGDISHSIQVRSNGVFIFTEEEETQELTRYLYHRPAPGLILEVIDSSKSNFTNLCETSKFIVYKRPDEGDIQFPWMLYDMHASAPVTFFSLDSSNTKSLLRTNNVCALTSENPSFNDEMDYIYVTNTLENKMINISHPKYNITDVQHTDYERNLLLEMSNLSDSTDQRLRLYKIDASRDGEDCGPGIRFYNDEPIPSDFELNLHDQEIILSGLQSSDQIYSVEKYFQLGRGATIEPGVNFEVQRVNCN